jgi:hypothetical protein
MCGETRGSDEYGTTALFRALHEVSRIFWSSVGGGDFDLPRDLEPI